MPDPLSKPAFCNTFSGRVKMWSMLGAIALLTACGGGGGGSTTPAPTPAPPPTAAPQPAPAPEPEPAKPFRIVCTGQSNMLGTNQDTSGQTLEDDEVTIWLDGWKVSTLYQKPYRTVTSEFVAPNNLCHWFAIRAHEELERPVEIAFHAVGGQSIAAWREGEHMWTDLQAKGSIAFEDGEPADVILWGQGETDNNWEVEVYRAEFLDVMDRLKSEPWVSETAPVLVMELNPGNQWDQMNALHSNWNGPEMWTASGEGLFGDGFAGRYGKIHYSGQSLQEMGYERMWDAWMESQQ